MDIKNIGKDVLEGGVEISTVYLGGLNYRFSGDGPPLLYESMVFGGDWDQFQLRYSTEDEAELGHQKIVEALNQGKDLRELLEGVDRA